MFRPKAFLPITMILMMALMLFSQASAAPLKQTSVINSTSFENEVAAVTAYVDTGDPTLDHPLVNNPGEPIVNSTADSTTAGDLGFTASYFATQGAVSPGLTDGDLVGVTADTIDVGAYDDGTQGYRLNDLDGRVELTFDPVDMTGQPGREVSIAYFITNTNWETVFSPPADKFSITISDENNNSVVFVTNANGAVDIDTFFTMGAWVTATANIDQLLANGSLTGNIYTLTVAVESNQDDETIYFDDVQFTSTIDTTPPSVISRDPNDGDNGVSTTTSLDIEFDEPVQKANSGTIEIVETGVGTFESYDLSTSDTDRVIVSGNTVIINPVSSFAELTDYHVLIPAGTITDLQGNAFAGYTTPTDYNFTTADVTPPALTALVPADDATNVSVDISGTQDLTATFNEQVNAGAGTIRIYETANDTTPLEEIDVTDASRVNFFLNSPTEGGFNVDLQFATALQAETDYYVQIDAGAVVDNALNAYPGITDETTWNFTTVDTTPPQIALDDGSDDVSPTGVQVPLNSNITASFTENITAPTNANDGYGQVYCSLTGYLEEFTAPLSGVNTFTYDPFDFSDGRNNGLYPGELCQVLLYADEITDGNSNELDGDRDGTGGDGFGYFFNADVVDTNNANLSPGLFRDSGQGLGSSDSFGVALGDVDGDGDLDAFVANNGANRVYTNENGTFTDTGQALGSGNSFGVALGDVDGDGDLDALVANFGQANRVYTNENGTFTDTGQALGSSDSVDVALGDVDGDGDLDAFVANDGANWVYTNENGTFTATGQALGNSFSVDVALGDVDGDGDLDALVANISGQANRVYTNENGTFTDTGQALGSSSSRGVALGDVDGDGDLDAFVANDGQANRVYLNGDKAPEVLVVATVPQLTPLDDATDVDPTTATTLQVVFDEGVEAASGGIELRLASDNSVVQTFDSTAINDGRSQTNVANDTVTLTISPALQDSTAYYVFIPATAIQDLDGVANAFAGLTNATDWNFTTGDFTAPEFVTLDPADDSTGVATTPTLTVTFNEDVQAGTGNITINRVSDDATAATFDVGTDVTFTGAQASFTVTSALDEQTEYYVSIPSGAITDTSANTNAYAGFTDNATWSFTTGDFTAPELAADPFDPADDSTGVALTPTLSVTFNENVQAGSGNITINQVSDDTTVATFAVGSDVTFTGATAQFTVTTALAESTAYYVSIPSGAITDTAPAANPFAGFTDNATWNFTTGDFTAPSVVTLNPADDSTGVATTPPLSIVFSETVQANTGSITLHQTSNDNVVATFDVTTDITLGTTTEANDTVSFTPGTALDEETEYYVLVPSGAITDDAVAPNAFAGISDTTAWSFTTGDFTAPELAADPFDPADDSTGVALTPTLSVTFNENVQAGSGNITINQVSDDVTVTTFAVGSDVTFTGATAQFTVTTALAENTAYYVSIPSGAITDTAPAANPFAGFTDNATWNFTTGDFTPPDAPVLTGITDDTGTSDTDQITNDTEITISGTAEANSTVEVFRGVTSIGTTTADGDGNFSLADGTTLIDGDYTYTATATDAADNTSAVSEGLVVTVDTTAPAVPSVASITDDTGASADDQITNDTTLTINGTADANSTVEVFRGVTSIGTATADGDGNFSVADGTTLAEGNYTYTSVASDTAGNESVASAGLPVTIDTTAPAVPVVEAIADDTGESNTDGITSDNTLTISGSAEADVSVEVFRGAVSLGTVTAGGDGSFSIADSISLPDGTYTYSAVTSDVAGNESAASAGFDVTIDTAAPAAPVLTGITDDTGVSNADEITNDTDITINGTAEANSTVEVFRGVTSIGTATADGAGNFAVTDTTTLTEGTYTYTATVTDAAGNTSAASSGLAVEIDTTQPTVATLTPADNSADALSNTTLSVQFNETVAAGTGFITLFDTGGQVEQFAIGTASITGDTVTVTPSTPLTPLEDYYVQIDGTAITDEAGNAFAGISDTTTWNFTVASRELVVNGDFADGETAWNFLGDIAHTVQSEVMTITRTDATGTATISQTLAETLTNGEKLEMAVDLGNTGPSAKRVTLRLLNLDNPASRLTCNVEVAASNALRTYQLEGVVPGNWTQPAVQIDVNDFNEGRLRVDNVSVAVNPTSDVTGVRCTEPSLPQNANLVTNSTYAGGTRFYDFESGQADGIAFGVSGGELNMTRTGTGSYAGVRQGTRFAVGNGDALTATVELGNSSSRPKNVRIQIANRGTTSLGAGIVCDFTVPANLSPTTYTLRGMASGNWANMDVRLLAQDFNEPNLLVDNWNVRYTPGAGITGTACDAPLVTNRALNVNGDFVNGFNSHAFDAGLNNGLDGEVLTLTRTDTGTVPAFTHTLRYAAPAGTGFTAIVRLGNTANEAKRVYLRLWDGSSTANAVTCTFTVPANTSLRQYGLGTLTNADWASVEVQLLVEDFNQRSLRVDDLTVRYVPGINRTICGSAPTADRNLVINGDFNRGEAFYNFVNVDRSISGGVLNMNRVDTNSTAYVNQNTYADLPAGSPLELTVQLGNTQASPRDAVLRLWDSASGSELRCNVSVAGNAPLQNYALRGNIPAGWDDVAVQIITEDGGQPSLLVDNLSVQYRPSLGTIATTCEQPDPPLSSNLITNGDFAQGTNFFMVSDTLQTEVVGGVLSMTRTDIEATSSLTQMTGFSLPGGSRIGTTVELGNSSSLEKTVILEVSDGGGRSAECVFAVPANTPLQTYTLLVGSPVTVSNFTVSLTLTDFNAPWLLVDNLQAGLISGPINTNPICREPDASGATAATVDVQPAQPEPTEEAPVIMESLEIVPQEGIVEGESTQETQPEVTMDEIVIEEATAVDETLPEIVIVPEENTEGTSE